MKRELMDILVCPVCKGELELVISHELENEIIDGTLNCKACPETYPIQDSIQNLLPPNQRS